MDAMTQRDLEDLLAQDQAAPKVSLFMPTLRTGDRQQNHIRFKNLLRSAEAQLHELEAADPAPDELLAPGWELLQETLFWQHVDQGLAVFAAPGLFRYYRLPDAFEEFTAAGRRFHLKPILPLIGESRSYYILALSQHSVKLLEAGPYTVRSVQLENVPTSLEDALGHDLTEQHLQFHTRTEQRSQPGTPRGTPMYFGQGGGEDDIKAEITQYLSRVDKGIARYLNRRPLPLMLAGVEYLLSIYRNVTDYTPLLEQSLTGNVETLREEELQAQTWALVEPHFDRSREDAVARYNELAASSDRASQRLEDIVLAALDGRVDTLFLARNAHHWGTVDHAGRRVDHHEQQRADSDDVLDLAAVQTFLKSGRLYLLEPGQVPGGQSAAAIFRY